MEDNLSTFHHEDDALDRELTSLVNADFSNGYEAYLSLFDRFYNDNIQVASDGQSDPLGGKARALPIIFKFLMPLHVIAEIGGLAVRLRWSFDLVSATGRSVRVCWSFARRWKDGRVVYERHSEYRQLGEALTMIDLDFGPRGAWKQNPGFTALFS